MWFYSENGEQKGPVSNSDFEALRSQGVIGPYTLVWREGQGGWLPCSTAVQTGAGVEISPDARKVPGAGEVQCSQCGRVFPETEVIRYGQASVCAECKPTFVQKLKEGVAIQTTAMEYVGFGPRFGAKFLDGIIGFVISWVTGFLMGYIYTASGGRSPLLPLFSSLTGFVIVFAFDIFLLLKFGATLGKMAVKIKVVRSDGSPVGLGTAVGRRFAEIVSGLIIYIGYFMVIGDPECRALHDRMCDTRVIRKK
jgi:uncharacterized RDD family membrane protein YckC